MVLGSTVEATGPSMSQLMSATTEMRQSSSRTSSRVKRKGEPSAQKWPAMNRFVDRANAMKVLS